MGSTNLKIDNCKIKMSEIECKGDGDCLEQKDDGSYDGSTFGGNYCPHECGPRECAACHRSLPLWVMNCSGGLCIGCDIARIARGTGGKVVERDASDWA